MKSGFLKSISGMTLGFVLFLNACAGSPAVSTAASAESQLPSIRITNNTGYTVYYVYVSPADSEQWGEDLLGDDVLMNGDYVNITLSQPLSEVNVYDIKLKDKEGDTYTKWDVSISAGSQIEFTIGDFDVGDIITNPDQTNHDMPSRLVANNTGYTIYFIYISQTTSGQWGPDRLARAQVLRSGNSFQYYLPYPLDAVNRYDFKLEDEDGDTYTKRNIPVRSNSRIVFTIGDLDTD
jgi:hypothetical protein